MSVTRLPENETVLPSPGGSMTLLASTTTTILPAAPPEPAPATYAPPLCRPAKLDASLVGAPLRELRTREVRGIPLLEIVRNGEGGCCYCRVLGCCAGGSDRRVALIDAQAGSGSALGDHLSLYASPLKLLTAVDGKSV